MGDWAAPAPGGIGEQLTSTSAARPPGFGITLLVILLPVLLMLVGTAAGLILPAASRVREGLAFVGSPLVALLVATLVSFVAFGRACGFDRATVLRFSEECVGPIANVLLVVGAGGGFGRVLDEAGVGQRDRRR